MPFSLPQIPEDSTLSHYWHLEVLEDLYPRALVMELLTRCHGWEQRERKLSQVLIVYYIMGLALLRRLNLAAVFAQVSRGLRWLWPDPTIRLPTASALVQRRQQLPTAVLRQLFRRCCRPLATAQTRGAFAFGKRLVALDGTLDEVADTPENARHFGRLHQGASQSPFPQVRCLYLAEVGTHAIIDAVLAPARTSEQRLAPVLLRSLTPDMLACFDSNFSSGPFLHALHRTGAQGIGRLELGRFVRPERVLADGSYLIRLLAEREDEQDLLLRVIEYRLEPVLAAELAAQPSSRTSNPRDPAAVHRLVTTLLDPEQAPALEVIECYHERWEIELSIQEIKVQQRLCPQPLRSKEPKLVYQELYGVLLAHYAVRAWMHRAALLADLDPDCLSFTHASQLLEAACYEFTLVTPAQRPRLEQRLLADLVDPRSLLPARRLRFCPRVVKRAWSSFVRKQPHHQILLYHGVCFRQLLLI